MSRLRVLHITTDGRIGGAERLIVDIVKASLLTGGIDPAICVLRNGDDLRAQVAADGITVHDLGLRSSARLPAVFWRLRRLISDGSYDVVHAHLLHATAIGLAAAQSARGSLAVMTRHYERYIWMYGTTMEKVLHRVGHHLADHIFAISEAARGALEEEGIAPERVTVVPNGIDVERVRLAGGDAVEASPGTVTIGTVGSLQARKGQADLVAAVAELSARHDIRLVLVGDGPLRDDLRRLAAERGITDRVRFAGYLTNPYRLVRNFDIYAQPSHEEGFGISVLEAMALERPIVSTTAGGLPELILDGVHGLLVPPGDRPALGRALERLIADPRLRGELGRRGRAEVQDRFRAAETAARYEDAYRRLLARRMAAPPA